MNSSPNELIKVQKSVTEDFSQCAFDISVSIFTYKNYGIKGQQSSNTVIYSTMFSSTTFEGDILEIHIQFTTIEQHNIIHFYSILSTYIAQLFPKSKRFSNYLNNSYTKALKDFVSTPSKELYINLDISVLPKSSSTFNLVRNKKPANIFEDCPVVKLSYLEINSDIRIVKAESGFFILVQNAQIQKIVNLKCYTVPTKLEFEILLSIALENIGRNNYEDLVFKSRKIVNNQGSYISGFEYLNDTSNLNVAIQYIACNIQFQLFFETVSRIDNLKFSYRTYPLLCATNVLFQHLGLNVSSYRYADEFKKAVLAYSRILEDHDQKDSSEFLQCFLYDLNQEFLRYFSNCPIYSATVIPTKSDVIEAIQLLNNRNFSGLSPRSDSTHEKCEDWRKSESNNFAMSGFQSIISQQETTQCVVKLYNFGTNEIQITHCVQVLYNSDLSIHKVKIDLAKLVQTYSYGIVLAVEEDLGQSYKGLKIIDSESKLTDMFTGVNFDLHCFAIAGSWNYEGRGYGFINHGIEKDGQFVHYEYSLFAFPDAANHKFQDLFDHVIKIMRSVGSVDLDFMESYLKNIKNEDKKSNNLNLLEGKVEDQPTLSNKSEDQNAHFSKLFNIYKLDGEYLDFDLDISLTKVQTESQFIEMFPLANGSNFLVVWNEESFAKLGSNINYKCNRPNSNNLDFPLSNQHSDFKPVPLSTLLKLELQYLNSVKDLVNEKTINSNSLKHKASLKNCVKNHLPPARFQPSKNRRLKFKREFCYSNVEEKNDCTIVDWEYYILSLIDLIKFIIYLMFKLWVYKLSFGI